MKMHILEIMGHLLTGVLAGYLYLMKQSTLKGRTLEDWYYDNFMWLERLADKYPWIRGVST